MSLKEQDGHDSASLTKVKQFLDFSPIYVYLRVLELLLSMEFTTKLQCLGLAIAFIHNGMEVQCEIYPQCIHFNQ